MQIAERCVHSGNVSNVANKACHLRLSRWQVILRAEAALRLLTENEPPPAGGPFGRTWKGAHVVYARRVRWVRHVAHLWEHLGRQAHRGQV